MSNNDERKNCMVTTVSIKHSERYIDMDGIQWRQAHSVYKCIQHLCRSILGIKCIQEGWLYKEVRYVHVVKDRMGGAGFQEYKGEEWEEENVENVK